MNPIANHFVPVTITARLARRDGRELEITLGNMPSDARRLFIEMVAVDEGHRVRLDWPAGSFARASRAGSAALATVCIDDHDPLPVVARSNRLFLYDDKGDSSKLFAPEELRWLGEYLLDLQLDPAGISANPPSTVYDLEGTAGCIASFGGAGAALGGAGGGLAGGVPGATAGGVVGGALGGSFGLGYCVIAPALEGLWNWWGDGDDDDDDDDDDDTPHSPQPGDDDDDDDDD